MLFLRTAAALWSTVAAPAAWAAAYSPTPTTWYAKTTSVTAKAYLNYLIFDREFNYLNGGFKRLTTSGRETGSLLPEGSGYDELTFDEGEIKITEPGFVYIYLSNENENRVEVFFDDFEVIHVKSSVVQMDNYYHGRVLCRDCNLKKSNN